jgi:hypothetical protein
MKRFLTVSALILFGLTLALGGLEVALRIGGAGAPPVLDPTYDRSPLRFAPDGDRRNPWARNEDDALRVAVIGDSFANGFANQWYDGYPQRLEHLLNLNADARPAQVKAFARNGTSTWDQRQFLDKALDQGADLIILGIFLNDTQTRHDPVIAARSVRIPTGWRLGLVRSSRALAWIYLRYENVRRNWTFDQHQEYLYSPDNRGFRLFKRAIRLFARTTREREVGLVAVIWPNMFALGSDYPLAIAHERIAQVLGQARVPYLDLLDEFMDKSPIRMAAFPGVDSHPSEIAHRVGATAIFEYLVAGGHIDSSYQPRQQRPMGDAYWLERVRRDRNRFGSGNRD